MQASSEVAAWLDLAEYARQLSDHMLAAPSKRTMIRIAVLCETLAFRYPDGIARSLGDEELNL